MSGRYGTELKLIINVFKGFLTQFDYLYPMRMLHDAGKGTQSVKNNN